MGIEWYRDLSITLFGFVATFGLILLGLAITAVLIFVAILSYRLYRKVKSMLLLAEATSKIAYDAVTQVQGVVKPLIPILAVVVAFLQGFERNKPGKEVREGRGK